MTSNFVHILREHQLSIGENDFSSESLQSFFQVFALELNVNQDELTASIRGFFDSELSNQVLAHEYGPHSRLVGSFQSFLERNFCPVLAMIASVAVHYKCKVIVACDDKNLSFQTKGELMCMIAPEIDQRTPIIVALTDMAIFRKVISSGPDQLENFIETMDTNAVLSLATLQVSDSSSDEYSDEALMDSDGSIDSSGSIDSHGSNYSDDSESSNFPVQNNNRARNTARLESKTIQSFLELNFFDEAQPEKVDPYTSDIRINILDSDIRQVGVSNRVTFNKYIDLDGVFAVMKPNEFCDSVISGGGIVKPSKCTNPQTLKSLRKHLFDSGINEKIKMNVIKFGKLNDANAFELYAVASWRADLNISETSIDLVGIFVRAHNQAKRFACASQGCPFSEEHMSISSGRPDDLNQIQTSTFVWEYAPSSFKCVLRDLARCMVEELDPIAGIELHFYARLIGSKFTLLTAEVSDFSKLIDKVADVLDLRHLAKSNPPRAFIDASWKFLANCEANNVNFS